jgi:F-type H+-transporting ATPase subunit epsilon
MTTTINVNIVSAENEIFSGAGEMIFAPATDGEVGITPLHTPLLTTLKPGTVVVRVKPEHEEHFYVSGGILEVQPNLVTILADKAARSHDLDEAEALEAKARAERTLIDKRADIDQATAQAELLETMAKLQAIQRLRNLRR